ncbi:hypothetical protein [Actinokineospora iranica]|uniref:Uncharacterized protein n=1 Tax=Actinokineospora iranica TaxID=1271860 RepID=A0A1G6PAW5_9PSEU|nr:hypothetical protein [Actinokineospora iranica]SDC77283.1 hypothetical protein SAMN05216174_104206 [Actinokineospora iranica]
MSETGQGERGQRKTGGRKTGQREAPAVEPPTDRPAIQDPATARAMSGLRLSLASLPVAVLLFGVPAAWLALAGAGWIAVTALAVAALAFLIATILTVLISGFWIGPASRLLRAQAWRPAAVTVFRPTRGFPRTRLLVREEDGTAKNLLAPALPWPAQQVLARTGRVWLVGPDARGWVAIRSAGLALPLGQARVTAEDVSAGYQIEVEQPAPVRAPLAAADAVLSRVIATPRRRSRTELVAPALLLVFAGFVVVDLVNRGIRPDQVWLAVFVGLGTLGLVALLAWRVRRVLYWAKADRLLAAGPWTPVPAEFAAPTRVRRAAATGRATLPDGRVVPVALRRSGHALRANIAATGLLWTAGPPVAGGEAAVGLPGYPFLTVARFGAL